MIKQRGYLSPRSIAILVILIIVLIVPLWWLRDGAQKRSAELAAEKAISQGTRGQMTPTVATITTLEVNDPNAFGMTWGLVTHDKLPASAAWMSCHGEPKEGISQAHEGSCNPYKGDASCRLALPVLCIKKDGSAADAAILAEMNKSAIQDGWAAGSVASTAPVAGFVLGSLEGANARCEKELGAGWRMASFHDGSGGRSGWGFTALRGSQLNTRLRHWVNIGDQPGNCWNNKG